MFNYLLTYREFKFHDVPWLIYEKAILNKSQVNYNMMDIKFKQKYKRYGWILFATGLYMLTVTIVFSFCVYIIGLIIYFNQTPTSLSLMLKEISWFINIFLVGAVSACSCSLSLLFLCLITVF